MTNTATEPPAAVAGRDLALHGVPAERPGREVSSGLIGSYSRMPGLELARLRYIAIVADRELRERLSTVMSALGRTLPKRTTLE